jgi:hypothetical protein
MNMRKYIIRSVGALLFGVGVLLGPAGCDTNDAWDFCRMMRESHYNSSPIVTKAYYYSSQGDVFCKAAIPDHNHYHCLRARESTHDKWQGWSYCPDDTAGPYW